MRHPPDPPDGTIIAALVDRADRMGRELAAEPFPRVLCHTDLHTWNVLVDAGRRPWIVDWDEAVLAPPERDLMFVVGGGIGHGLVGPGDTDAFFQGYGRYNGMADWFALVASFRGDRHGRPGRGR
jgi:Ser/Thr protein kinase RdoA (MazF antagonist)